MSFKAEFGIWHEGQLLYQVIEKSANILFFTKLRSLFPLEMELVDLKTKKKI